MQARRSSLYKAQPSDELSVIVLDNFNSPAWTDLAAHTPDLDPIGGGWSEHGGYFEAGGSLVQRSKNVTNIASIDAGVSDGIVSMGGARFQLDISNRQRRSGLVVRVTDSSNYIFGTVLSFTTTPWTWRLEEYINGSTQQRITQLGNSSGLTNNFIGCSVILDGPNIRFLVPSEDIDITMVSTHNLTATRHGAHGYTNYAIPNWATFQIEG